jgi:uncharacterized protein YaaQ
VKLLIAIVHADDIAGVGEELRSKGHRFTRIASVGGYLGEANATFLLAVEDGRIDDVIACFERSVHSRDVDVPPVLLERLADWRARTVRHTGATLLIADLERLHQT